MAENLVMNHLDQGPRQRRIFPLIEETGRSSSVAHPPSATDPVRHVPVKSGQVNVNLH